MVILGKLDLQKNKKKFFVVAVFLGILLILGISEIKNLKFEEKTKGNAEASANKDGNINFQQQGNHFIAITEPTTKTSLLKFHLAESKKDNFSIFYQKEITNTDLEIRKNNKQNTGFSPIVWDRNHELETAINLVQEQNLLRKLKDLNLLDYREIPVFGENSNKEITADPDVLLNKSIQDAALYDRIKSWSKILFLVIKETQSTLQRRSDINRYILLAMDSSEETLAKINQKTLNS